MNVDLVVQLLLATGAAGVIGAVVNGYLNRRKLGAEATEIITKAASGVVERLERENARLALRISVLEKWQEAAQINVDNHRMVLQLHAAWDHLAMADLVAAGSRLPEAPPLYPPHDPTPFPTRPENPDGH